MVDRGGSLGMLALGLKVFPTIIWNISFRKSSLIGSREIGRERRRM